MGLTEPGASLTVVVYALAQETTYNPDGTANPPQTVDVGGVTVEVQDGAATRAYKASYAGTLGTWNAICQIFRSAATTLQATAAAGNATPLPSSPVQVPLSLDSDAPTLQVVKPAQPPAIFQVALGETGGSLDVEVTMADSAVFGARTVTVTPDSGVPATVALAPVPGSTTQYAGTVSLGPLPFPSRVIQVTGTCQAAPEHPHVVSVSGTASDVAPPDKVQVLFPAASGGQVQVAGTAPNFTVTVTGSAQDLQSGMVGGQAAVAVALAPDTPPAQRIPATPLRNPGDLREWTATIPVPQPPPPGTFPPSLGTFTFYVWATDAAGNPSGVLATWAFTAVNIWQPPTVDDRLSEVEYLQDLIEFANRTVGVWQPGSPPVIGGPGEPGAYVGVTPADLDLLLAQPVTGISVTPPRPAVTEPVNELRVPIEVLRTHMARQSPPIPASQQGQDSCLWAAYQAILAQIGTSYPELREARAAADGARAALADRLGIPLYQLTGGPAAGTPAVRYDQLDAITLAPAAAGLPGTLIAGALQNLFGLADTTPFDPAQPPPPPSGSSWRQWQLEHQRTIWLTQDRKPPVPQAYVVVVDPDVITAADIPADPVTAPRGDAIRTLRADRASQLDTMASTLRATRTAHAGNPDGGLAALISAANLGTDLASLQTQDAQGADISAQLAAAGLDRPGFSYLVQMGKLAAVAPAAITGAEWEDAVTVLVGAFRRRDRYPVWLSEERGPGSGTQSPAVPWPIVLSPDDFATGPDPAPQPLRVDPRARRDWVATLQARTLQRRSLDDAWGSLIGGAEGAALPVLRDALLADIALATAPPGTVPDAAGTGERLTARYQIDVLISGALTTTRVKQAITSTQTLIEQVRAGANTPSPGPGPAGTLALTAPGGTATFDADWDWIGTYEGWKAATTTFLFPEAYLDPRRFSRRASAASTTAWQKLSGDLTGAAADDTVQAYMTDISTVVQGALGGDVAGLDFSALTYEQSSRNTSAMRAISARLELHDPGLAVEVFWAVPMLAAQVLRAQRRYQDALNWLWLVANPGTSPFDRIANEAANTPQQNPPDLTLPPGWPHLTLAGPGGTPAASPLDPFTLVSPPLPERPYAFQRATLLAIAACMLEWADDEFTAETNESIAHARTLYRSVLQVLEPLQPPFLPLHPLDARNAALLIPQVTALRTRADSQLGKIRQDRNIAGLQRTQAQFGGPAIRQATPYHFKTLLTRAQQLTQQAAGIEAQFLSAAEKYAAQRLAESDARASLDLTTAQLTVHDAQVQQATDNSKIAYAQQVKASDAVAQLTAAINAPLSSYERNLLANYSDMRDAQELIAGGELAIGLGQAAAEASNVTKFGLGAIGAGLLTAGALLKFGGQTWLNEIQQSAQENQLRASIENRQQEWRLQLAAASQDVSVAAAQAKAADDQVGIAKAERAVAAQQADQAATHLKLLLGQFTNVALYQWLSTTLNEVYRYFLQQATSVALLAQAQLAFERAEPPQTFIRGDYWQPLAPPASTNDTRGLAGAEQLAEDLAKLDEYAFSSDTRKLNLTQTFSLATLAPMEFLDFRATGQIAFATPAALFDQDFPGHFHRLIRQARLSVVALVPPGRGIRATLASNGISRVVTQASDAFSEIVLRRDPTVVGLTSPVDASGVFAIDLQPDILLPFEGSGVDTTWELIMPPAANPFDFRTISDVLLTIDYTALTDFGYQAQVVRRLNANRRTRQGDSIFSLARDFPDQWYALHNPDPASASVTPRAATLTLRTTDFPAAIDPATLATANIAVRLTGPGQYGSVTVTIAHGGGTAAPVTDVTGTASTRRGNDWGTPLEAVGPAGDWTVSFDPAASSTLFAPGGLDDIVLVISWAGQSLPWPA